MIHAVAELQRQGVAAFALIVGGSAFGFSSGYAGELEGLARQLGIEDRVMLTGQVSDPRPYYELMDVFVNGSAIESFGIVIVEAMLAGRPGGRVRRRRAERDHRRRRDGLLISEGNLVATLAKLEADPALRERVALKGAERARTSFGAEARAAAFTNAILEAEGPSQVDEAAAPAVARPSRRSRARRPPAPGPFDAEFTGTRSPRVRSPRCGRGRSSSIVAPWAERAGGAEEMLWTILRHLDPARVQPEVGFLSPGPFVDEIASLGITSWSMPATRLRNPVGDARTVVALARLLRGSRPNVVLGWSAKTHLYLGVAALLARGGCPCSGGSTRSRPVTGWSGSRPRSPPTASAVPRGLAKSRSSAWFRGGRRSSCIRASSPRKMRATSRARSSR